MPKCPAKAQLWASTKFPIRASLIKHHPTFTRDIRPSKVRYSLPHKHLPGNSRPNSPVFA